MTEHTRYEPTPAELTRMGVDSLILDRVRAERPEAIELRTPPGMSDLFAHPELTDYRDGIAAALAIANVAANTAHRYAEKARGAGIAWADLAEPLGFDPAHPDAEGTDPGEWAFRKVAGPRRAMIYDSLQVGWRCDSCEQWVMDGGPYNGHPDDDESGHAADCERHAREIEAWRARTGWDDDDQDDQADAEDGTGGFDINRATGNDTDDRV